MDLIAAVIHNDQHAVRHILAGGADPNFCHDRAKVTPLHHAAQHNAVEVVELLITAGANIHARTKPEGETPLDVAKKFQHQEMMALLLHYAERMP